MFSEFIKNFKAGHLDSILGKKLTSLVKAVETHSLKGKLTIDIELKPKADGEMLTSIKYKLKAPERDTLEAIMFSTPESNLIDSNPKQPDMFQPVATPKDAPASLVKSI